MTIPSFLPLVSPRLASQVAGIWWLACCFASSTFAAIPTFSTPVAGRAPDPVFTTAVTPVIAKLDGDNVNDFVTADAAGTSVYVSFGNVDGSAKSSFTLTGPGNAVAVAAGDLNHDGKQDIVVASEHMVRYFLNDGMAPFPFSAFVDVASPDVRIVSLALADFSQEGFLDLLVSGDGDDGMGATVGFVQSFLNTVDVGDAFLGYGAPTKYQIGATASRMVVGDLNNDNYPDVALARMAPAESGGEVIVSFGNLNGFTTNFLNSSQHHTAMPTYHPLRLAIGDVTADGKVDLVTTSYMDIQGAGVPLALIYFNLLRNLGNSASVPTFQAGEHFYFDNAVAAPLLESDVKIADINGDGAQDIVTLNLQSVGLNVFRVSPFRDESDVYQSLNVDAHDVFPVSLEPRGVAVGDLNGDGAPDVVVAHSSSGGITTLVNTTPLSAQGPINKAIQFDLAAYTANEGNSAPAEVIVKRAADSTGTVTVKFAVTGTATPNGNPHSDFVLANPLPDKAPLKPGQNTATLTFLPNETEKHIFFGISSDPGSEPDETIILTLLTPAGDAVLGSPRIATVTIKDSEPPALRGGNKLTVAPSKPLPLIAADRPLGVKLAGRTPDPWTFTTTETKDATAPGLAIKVQYSVTGPNGPWTDLPGGNMSRPGNKGTKWAATSLKVPDSLAVLFRTVSSATNITSGNGPATTPCRAVASPVLRLSIKAEPASHINSNETTYPEESIQYKISYENVSSVPAANVTVGVQIPGGTHSDNGNGSPGIQFLTNAAGEKVAAYFDLGTVGPGSTGTCRVDVVVNADLLDGKPPKTPLRVGFASGQSTIFTDRNSFAKLRPQPVYGAICDDPVPARTPKALSFGGPEVSTPVNQPMEITCVADKTIVELDDTIVYTVTLHNRSSQILRDVVYLNSLPVGTAFESAHRGDGTGNFRDEPVLTASDPDLFALGANPALTPFQFGVLQRTLKWKIATFPAEATRVIKFTIRTLADAIVAYRDKDGVLHTPEIVNRFYEVTALTQSARTFRLVSLQQGEKPFRTLLSGFKADQQPQIGLNKEVQGTGKGRGELRGEHDGDTLIPSDVETVLPGDDLEYTVHFWNTGDAAHPIVSTARNFIIQEELADQVVFHGGMKIFGFPIALPDPRFVFRDKKGVVLPYPNHTLTQDFGAVRLIETHFGDLSPNNVSKFSYLATPKVALGKFIYSRDCRLWTTSLRAVKYNKQQVVAKVVKPITFAKKVLRDKSDQPPIPAGDLLKYTVVIRNNGGVQASNVRVNVPIPKGTKFQAGTAVTNDVRVPVALSSTISGGVTTALTFTIASLHASEATSVPDPNNPDTASMSFTVKLDDPFPLPAGTAEGAFDIVAAVKGQYPSGGSAFRLLGSSAAAAGTQMSEVDDGADFVTTRVRNGPMGPSLWALKQYPQYVTPGQKMVYTIVCGNSGTKAVQNVRVGIVIPNHTVLDKANTTGGYEDDPKRPVGDGFDRLQWNVGDLAAQDSRTFFVVLDMLKDAAYPRDQLIENSCAVDSDTAFFDGKKLIQMNVVPGPATTNVFSDHPVINAWQAFCAMLQSWGANLFGKGNAQVEAGVKQFGDGSINTTMRGVDVVSLESGALYIQNGPGNIVAAGGGNLIAGPSVSRAGFGRIVAAGGGNASGGGKIVAAGGGNIVAAGGGNLISVQGIGFCTQANVTTTINKIVAGGGGNIVAAGGGNLVRINNGVASLVGQDGAGLRDNANNLLTINRTGGGLLDGGGGNFIVSGPGHVFSPGDFIATAPLVAGKKGAAVVVNGNGKGTVSVFTNPAMARANVVANDGAGVVANDGAGVISDKGAGAFANDPEKLLGNDGASVVANDGAGLLGNDGASILPTQ